MRRCLGARGPTPRCRGRDDSRRRPPRARQGITSAAGGGGHRPGLGTRRSPHTTRRARADAEERPAAEAKSPGRRVCFTAKKCLLWKPRYFCHVFSFFPFPVVTRAGFFLVIAARLLE
ncbi:hypothetical protein PAHAL_4G027700 [Panicum hallii]|uniref:Uncharacterized protein n=1 Tax=Panicum hallii TaxID=206008 RepID=A0A2T8JBI6_9POAL|nr:hypothetical protein PAHAL_4G027700 [Panicum hallii]